MRIGVMVGGRAGAERMIRRGRKRSLERRSVAKFDMTVCLLVALARRDRVHGDVSKRDLAGQLAFRAKVIENID